MAVKSVALVAHDNKKKELVDWVLHWHFIWRLQESVRWD